MKKKVLVFIDWYLPGQNAGGPVRTMSNMVKRLSDFIDFRIVTRDTDLNAEHPYDGIVPGEWNQRDDGSSVYYLSKAQQNYTTIKQIIADEKPDAIHLNSMFSVAFTLYPLRAVKSLGYPCKLVLGPRGMLSSGALAIKPFKKKLFIFLAGMTGMFKNVIWHASTPVEAAEIKKVFGDHVRIKLAIDLADNKPVTRFTRKKTPGNLKLYFLGRISPVKNLMQCLEVLKLADNSLSIDFDIYGPSEDESYLAECKKMADSLPDNVRLSFKGQVDNAALTTLLKDYHCLFLLTENENYGHAIVEGLTSGCPVIISDRTPWRNLEAVRAGYDLSLDNNRKVAEVVSRFAGMDQQEYDLWMQGAFTKAESIVSSDEAVRDNLNLFGDS
jgi:glycosyltransferase involved in cell wall biosynthesis